MKREGSLRNKIFISAMVYAFNSTSAGLLRRSPSERARRMAPQKYQRPLLIGGLVFAYYLYQYHLYFHSPPPPKETKTLVTKKFPDNVIQRDAGTGWKMINFLDPQLGDCDHVSFTSTTGNSAKMCVHTMQDVVSDSIRHHKRWSDCDPLPKLWNAAKTGALNEVYVDMGANIGSCVMEMLMSTDANIVAFEPTPRNYELLSRTIQLLGPEYQRRVALFPIGLGSESVKSQVYSGEGNMGNSVIGKPIKDFGSQEMKEPVDIFVERIDSLLSDNVSILLMKLDVQGFECKMLDGMSPVIAANINQIKFEIAENWLDQQGCTDLLPRLRNLGFVITESTGKVIESSSVHCGVCDAFATKK